MVPRWPAILLILAIVAGCLALYAALALFLERRTSRALADAARSLGLRPMASDPGKGVDAAAGHEGEVSGVHVHAAAGWLLANAAGAVGAKVVPISRVVVVATLPRPLGFDLELRRRGWPQGRKPQTGDPAFDRACRIRTSREQAVRSFFASSSVRDAVRMFVEGTRGIAVVTGTEVLVPVYGAHVYGAPSVTKEILAAVAVACKLSARAEEMGG